MNLHDRAKKIKLIILDVDGVLTDGRFGYTSNPDEEIKFFNAKDGHAIKMALRAGLMIGVISGRESKANRKRFQELDITFFHERQKDKLACFDKVIAEYNLAHDEILYIGDDIIDMPIVKRCGIGVAVADAVPELIKISDMVTEINGGHGAVREVIAWLMQQQGSWAEQMERYYR